jgi:glycosyltransferase involved in cell wall biosynthesis
MNHEILNEPLVSIITATYNRAKYLPLTMESVLSQSFKNFEHHIVDDGSTDNTYEVIKDYLKDSRIHYHAYQMNRGQSVARNLGLKHSIGEFICFIDSDNLWMPNKLKSQLKVFEGRQDVDIVYGDGLCIDEFGEILPNPNMKRYSGEITEKLLMDNFVSFNTAMIRRECFTKLGGMDEKLRRADDYELWLRLSTEYKFYYYPGQIAKYRILPNSISANKEERFTANKMIIDGFFERYPQYANDKLVKDTWARFYVRRGRSRAFNGQYWNAFLDHIKAMSYRPFSVGPWRALARMILLWK